MAKKDENTACADNDVIARNKKAYHDFEILESMETGIELRGTEVKSCRMRSVQLQDTFARVENGELFVFGLHISPYSHGNRFNHEAVRRRKLLMHKKEILKLFQRVREKGFSLIPLKMYLKRGRVKLELGVARGKTFGDKRETLKKRQDDLDARRHLGSR
ncbi:MAG: SsrA-binding protein SmpB [Lentisphaeria bacterium]|nr:SsrA-binding protein SmpB [Lentisphaerota bacterium]MBO5694184.1 SsrA-binding protein SmpB [Lentisphaeria bacterium]MBO5803087.1 SsrA-binding protein SmpB [Lentisphaeria bacterium]MBQ7401201.1 SsrA-binding protein SmpB [Lentisphaeria bacterium]MBR2000181.1 SsrA-binding protein SmpB [Lentisphaeria bacterium]